MARPALLDPPDSSGTAAAPEPGAQRRRGPSRTHSLQRAWWLVPALAPFAVFWRYLTGSLVLVPGDGGSYYYPLHVLAARQIADGRLPTYNPFEFSGSALLAVGQAGVLYPPNLAFLVLPDTAANNLVLISTLSIAATGAALLGRHLTGSRLSGVLSGLAFGFGSFFTARFGHQAIIETIAWLPWALWSLDLLIQKFTARRLLGGALVLGLAATAGHAQMLLTILMMMGLYAAVRTLLEWRGVRGRGVVALAGMVVAGLAVGAAQLLPTAQLLGISNRSDYDYNAATEFSLPKTHLFLQVFPSLFGSNVTTTLYQAPYAGTWNLTEMTGAAGVVVLVLAAAGLTAVRRDPRTLALLAGAAVCLVIALGKGTPVSHLIYDLPVYGTLRVWARNLVGLDLVVALLAGYGLAQLRSAARRTRLTALAATAAAGLGVLVLAAVVSRLDAVRPFLADPDTQRAAKAVAVLGAAVAVLGAAGLALRGRPGSVPVQRLAALLLVVAVVVEPLVAFGWSAEWRNLRTSADVNASTRAGSTPGFGPVVDQPGGLDRYVYLGTDLGRLPQYYGVTDTQGARSIQGYDPLGPLDYSRLVGDQPYWGGTKNPELLTAPGSNVLDILRVTTVIRDQDATALPPGSPVAAGTVVPGLTLTRSERVPAVPDAYLVGATRTVGRQGAIDAALGKAPLDLPAEAVLEQGCPGCELAQPGSSGSVVSQSFDGGRVRAQVTSDRPGLLVVSRAWLPDWQATVNGRPAPVVRADALVLGVPVPAGDATVVLTYRARGVRTGLAVSGLALLVLVGAALLPATWWRRPGSRRSAPPTADQR